MASVLRLNGKDRSPPLPFKFFKRQNNTTPDILPIEHSNLEHHLPSGIAPVGSRSFENFFDCYLSHEQANSVEAALPPYEKTPASTTTLKSLNNVAAKTKTPAKRETHQRSGSSSSSCYSQPSHGDSDFSSAQMTRQSSSSSYTPDSSPTPPSPPKTIKGLKPPPLTIPRQPVPARTRIVESPVSDLESPPKNLGLVRVVSGPPNLNKPLPLGPDETASGRSSAPNLTTGPKRKITVRRRPVAPAKDVFSDSEASLQPKRKTGLRRASDNVAARPKESTPATKEIRSGRTPNRTHHRVRSASEAETRRLDRSMRPQPKRHTTDVHKLVSQFEATAQAPKGIRSPRKRPITASTAEQVIYQMMSNLHSAEDLQATAMVSKGFLRTFQRNESKLVSQLIFKKSKAAWELRRSMLALQDRNDFLLKDYLRDCRTIDALKTFIVAHCGASCKQHTILGLLGHEETRASQIDGALWRVWTFCTLFGNSAGQPSSVQAQIDWLNGNRVANNKKLGTGYAIGNGDGVTTQELEDMTEMWQCMQVLMSGFLGRERDAKKFGIFENWHLRQTSSASEHLAEWTAYLLCLGPLTVLSLSSCSFDQAKVLGLTQNWPAPPVGQTRTAFLTSAVARVYQERILLEATRKATQMSVRRTTPQNGPIIPPRRAHRPSRSMDDTPKEPFLVLPTHRYSLAPSHNLRIDTSPPPQLRQKPPQNAYPDAPVVIRPDCDPESRGLEQIRPDNDPSWDAPSPVMGPLSMSPTNDPAIINTLNTTRTASTRLGATLFPMAYADGNPRVPFPIPERSATMTPPLVQDPVDKAMNMLVHQYGVNETRARKALAMCDTGSGIDLQKAIDMLFVDTRMQYAPPAVELPTPAGSSSSGSPSTLQRSRTTKAYCDGQCKRTPSTPTGPRSRHTSSSASVSMTPSSSQASSTAANASISPVSESDEAEWADTISPLNTPFSPSQNQRNGSGSVSSLTSKLSRGASRTKAWKVLGIVDKATPPTRKCSVLKLEDYQAKVERRQSMRAGTDMVSGKPLRTEELRTRGSIIGLGAGPTMAMASSAAAKSVKEHFMRQDMRQGADLEAMPRYA
jgi:hypothetical protein